MCYGFVFAVNFSVIRSVFIIFYLRTKCDFKTKNTACQLGLDIMTSKFNVDSFNFLLQLLFSLINMSTSFCTICEASSP